MRNGKRLLSVLLALVFVLTAASCSEIPDITSAPSDSVKTTDVSANEATDTTATQKEDAEETTTTTSTVTPVSWEEVVSTMEKTSKDNLGKNFKIKDNKKKQTLTLTIWNDGVDHVANQIKKIQYKRLLMRGNKL